MTKHDRIIIVIILSLLLLRLPYETADYQLSAKKETGATPAAIDILQMIPDPNLESEPDAFVNGTSGEFNYVYSDNIMQLNWTHTKGTTLDFSAGNDDDMPSYNDFVYFTQSFDWPYEERPEKAIMHLNYSVTTIGSFTNTSNQNMFKLYSWLIDSSGDWVKFYETSFPYYSAFIDRRINIGYVDLLNGIYGMIEDEFGIQEDPEDILTVGIGLAPTDYFQSSIANGSVIVAVSSMNFHIIMEAEPDPETHLTPLYNKTFETKTRDIFPGYTGDITNVMDNLRQMTKDPQGNLYVTGDCGTSYELREEEGLWNTHQFLIKYSPTLNPRWIVRNDNLTRGRAITYHDDYIYTTGYFYREEPDYYNLMLTKWSTSGQKIWEKEWGGVHDQVGVALAVHNDGSIYVLVSDYNIRSEPSYQNTSLIEFDSSGNVVNITQPLLGTYFDAPMNLWVFENRIVYSSGSLLACLDLEGSWIWGVSAHTVTCDDNGTIYSAVRESDGVVINQYNLEGHQTWSTYYQLEYPNGWYEDLAPYDIALTPTDEVMVLVQGNRYDKSYFLLKYSVEGNHLQTWSIGNIVWPYPGMRPPQMEVTSTGLAYFTFEAMAPGIWIQGYAIGEYSVPFEGPDTLTIAIIGGGIGVITFAGIYVYRKKQA
jgi:hypothetical protein